MTGHRGLALALAFISASHALAQGSSGPTISDSKVGYIDTAIPANLFRLRYDSAYDSVRSSRAEFFYAPTSPVGPGLPLPERVVDFQDINAYFETGIPGVLTGFVEAPLRFLNPEINDNHTGIGDMNAGFKWAFLRNECSTLTFQFRTYIPTGNARLGLGTDHVSLEPALLGYRKLSDKLRVEGELRWWTPVGGDDFAGDVLRYGVGVSYTVWSNQCSYLAPVVELVGWTALDGQESGVTDAGVPFTESAAGNTIVNIKFGARMGLSESLDVYAGYGRPLTGDTWYDHVFRAELRWRY
jgi:hypothetical protein